MPIWHSDRVVEPRFRWSFPIPLDLDPALFAAGVEHGLSPRLVELLARREVRADEIATFFTAPELSLCDPALLPDALVFRDRVTAAIAAREPVMVFGDFDADGLTGLAILVRAF